MTPPDGKLGAKALESAEIKLETLQSLSYELISTTMELWRTFKDTSRAKGQKISRATQIHEMIIDAIRWHPDIRKLRELANMADEVRMEIDAARKVHALATGSEATSPNATS